MSDSINIVPIETDNETQKITTFMIDLVENIGNLSSAVLKRSLDNDLVSFSSSIHNFIYLVDPAHSQPNFTSLEYNSGSIKDDIHVIRDLAGEINQMIESEVIGNVDINGSILYQIANMSQNFDSSQFMQNLSSQKNAAVSQALQNLNVISYEIQSPSFINN